jgi:signal transduction histidine kinase
MDSHIETVLTTPVVHQLRQLVVLMVVYMVVRTWLAYADPPKLKWWYIFPPIDVALITLLLCTTHRGPMSNITLLFFLPMVHASGSLNVRWSAIVGLLVIAGTTVATLTAYPVPLSDAPTSLRALIHEDPLNVAFRVFFLLIISSLMAYQALIAAGYRERLGVAADRNRIAMEMHDGVQGHLITIASQLELIARVAEKDGKHAASIAVEGREGARQAADELRFLVQRLRSPTLESGFVGALRQYAHNICDRNGLQLVFEQVGVETAMSPEVENALFRIAQESLTNVVKHAGANAVTISVDISETSARLLVQDDGIGMSSGKANGGLGLDGMRSRAEMNHGSLHIESAGSHGTRVVAIFTIQSKHG